MVALWQAVLPRMAGLPICNPALDVQATRFVEHAPWCIGVVVTPWCMNVVAVPDDAAALPPPGTTITLALPAGDVAATVSALAGFGLLASASLFSPMEEFNDPAVALSVAEAALAALFDADAPSNLDRRALLRGRRAAA
jgi:[NiFe] hydrogenase assembly HybE family chaperone